MPLHLLIVHAVAISHDLRGAFSGVLVLLAGAGALVLDCLYLHFERLRLFGGQNTLTVAEVVIRNGEDGFMDSFLGLIHISSGSYQTLHQAVTSRQSSRQKW